METELSQPPYQLTDDFRIAAWRKDRAAIANESRVQRLHLASGSREQRLVQFEIDKDHRIEANRLRRAAELAEKETARRSEMYSRLVGLEDLTDVEIEFRRAQRRQHRAALLRLWFFVGVPVVLAALYATVIAQPVYDATTILAVTETGIPGQSAQSAPAGSTVSYKVRHYMTSSDMLALMQEKTNYLAQFDASKTDLAFRQSLRNLWGADALSRFRRHVETSYDIQENVLKLRVDGDSPEHAQLAALAIIELAEIHFNSAKADESYLTPSSENGRRLVSPAIKFEILSTPYSAMANWQQKSAKLVFSTLVCAILFYSVLTVMTASFFHYSRR